LRSKKIGRYDESENALKVPLLSLLSPVQNVLNMKERSMHPLYEKASKLTGEIIAAAIEVHKTMGPGLIESIYEWCLVTELESRGFRVSNQKIVTISYKGFHREEPLRYDVLVDDCVLVELKAAEDVHPIHKAKLISYLKLLDVPLGLLITFHVEKLTDGVSRLILPGAGR
jgi:GxxExxY protein